MIYSDPDFGDISVRFHQSTEIKFSILPSGRLKMSVPKYTTNFLVKVFLNANRQKILAQLPIRDPATQRARDLKQKLLRKQAKKYLPYRLDYFAKLHGYKYQKLRFSHAKTRWGSCSSGGTISLNIALMDLPKHLRDYVIIHELAHLSHLNHSSAFWQEVALHDPDYQTHRQELKNYSPLL